MTRALRYFRWELNAALLILLAAGVIFLGVDYVSAKHAQSSARERICAGKVEALRARNVWAQRFVCPASPCLCLDVVSRP